MRPGGSGRDRSPLRIGVDRPSKPEMRADARRGWQSPARSDGTGLVRARASDQSGALFPDDIAFDRRSLAVRRRGDRRGTIGQAKKARTATAISCRHLSSSRRFKERRLAGPRARRARPGFPDKAGGVLDHGGLVRAPGVIQHHAGVVDAKGGAKYGPHPLRHFFASWCIAQGFSPKRPQALMGHGSIRMTFDTCRHLFPNAGGRSPALRCGRDRGARNRWAQGRHRRR